MSKIYLLIEHSKYSTYTDSTTLVYMVTDNKEKAKSVMQEKYEQMRKDFLDFVHAYMAEVTETMDLEKNRMTIRYADLFYKLYVEEHIIE